MLTDAKCPLCERALNDKHAIECVQKNQKQYDQKIIAMAEYKFSEKLKKQQEQSAKLQDSLQKALNATKEAELKAQQREKEATARALADAAKLHLEQLTKKEQEINEIRRHQEKALKDEIEKIKIRLADDAKKDAQNDVDGQLRVLKSALQKAETQNKQLQDRLNGLNGPDRGEFSEQDLERALTQAFPMDELRRVGKGRAGADAIQIVRYRAGDQVLTAGKIVYENKDQSQWRAEFLDQAKAAQARYETRHVVLVSKLFPNGQKELYRANGITVVHPDRVIYLVSVMRDLIIDAHRAGLNTQDLSEMEEYLSSESFRQTMDSIVSTGDQLKEQMESERKAHERTWGLRLQAYNALIRRATGIDAAIQGILQRACKNDSDELHSVKAVHLVSSAAD